MPPRKNKHIAEGRGDESRDARETERTILQVAQQLFMEHGYRAVSTRQIADACGLTQPALYHYFRDKQELYLAMALEELAKTQAGLERITRRNDAIEERLQQVAVYLISVTQHDLSLMLHDIRHELAPEARTKLYHAFYDGIVAPIASIFEEGIRHGKLRDNQQGGCDPITAAFMFMSLVSNILTREQHTEHLSSQRESARQMIHILLYGLALSNT